MKLLVSEFETCQRSYMCQLGQCSEESSAGLCEIKDTCCFDGVDGAKLRI